MGESFQKRITALLLSNKRHTRYVVMVACMAVAVVFGVTVGLTQEGQAKTHEERVLDCQYSGDGAHTHDASCYDADGNLVCPLAEREYHVHDDSCYASETYLVCGLSEGDGAHSHDESCYDEAGELVCGLEESAGHVHDDSCWQTDTYLACGKEEVSEEHVHGEACFKTVIVEDGTDEVVAEAEPEVAGTIKTATEPAKAATTDNGEQTFAGELRDANGNVIVSVAVKAPKGALPDGATMRVEAVDEAAIKGKVDEAVKAESGEDAVAKSITAVDIAFLDKDGNEVEPSEKVEVKITSAAVRDIDAPALVHIDEEQGTAEVVRNTSKVNADDEDTSTGNEDTLKFDTDKFSPYVIVETEELHGELLTGNGGVYDVTVIAGAEAGIPADAQLQVTELAETSDAYLTAFDEVVAQKKAEDESFDEATLGMAAFDITIVDADGNPFEPLAPVNVTVSIAQLPTEAAEAEDTVELQHLDTSTGETVVETVATVADETLAIDGGAAVAEFALNGFSTFALTWDTGKADIHWGIMKDGKFEEWDHANLDTSTGSISLNALYDGYTILNATYYTASESVSDSDAGTDIEWSLSMNDDGTWQYTVRSSVTTGTVADGSQIYVYYIDNDDIPETEKPEVVPSTAEDPLDTTKTVVPNLGDDGKPNGTYKITLDVTGKVNEDSHTEVSSANVIMVLDVSTSMDETLSGGQTRLAAVKSAAMTLVDAMPNAANVEMAVVSFGGSVTTNVNWTTISSDNVKASIKSTINGLTTNQGTNWTDAMSTAKTLADNKKSGGDTDPTYVIFLTDGCPTTNKSGHSHGSEGTQLITDTCISDPLATMTQMVSSGYTIYGIYANITSSSTRPYSGSSWNAQYTGDTDPLQYVMRVSGAGTGNYYQASEASALEEVFEALAKTITENLGYSNVSVDDGITSLTSVEASVSVDGAAGNFEYKRSGGQYGSGRTWTDAPAASASGTGVTWDLSSIGNLENGVTYTVSFDIWPSQEAYDLIADLNNGLVDYDSLEPEVQAQIVGDATSGYSLLTNTFLHTNYSYNGGNYMYDADKGDGAMALAAEKISLEKLWPANALDRYGAATYRDENGEERTATDITLTLTKAGEDYMDVTVAAVDGWKKDDVYVSCGLMTVKDGVADIKEPGYDYTVTEPASFSYYWDLIADVYHPMVINGTSTLLVLDEEATSADYTNTFEIDGKIYRKTSEGTNTLEASNYRRSNLNLTKVVDPSSAPETWFEYTVTVDDVDSTDGYVWFSAWDPKASSTVKSTDWVISGATAEAGDTGYWYATNGTTVTLKLKAGWNVRFLNLKHGSTFTFSETGVGDGFTYEKAETSTQETIDDTWSQVDNESKTVTGTIIEPNNSYTVTYTNKWTTDSFTIEKVDENNDPLTGATFTLTRDKENVTSFKPDELKNNATTDVELGSATYCLTETEAPAGYNILSNKIYIKVIPTSNGLEAILVDSDGAQTSYENAVVSEDGKTITVSNTPGSELPMTGGPGTTLFTITGSAIIAVAVTYGITSRRRREGGLN